MPAKSKAFVSASKQHPCPVCDGDHKCARTPDGLFLCGRNSGPVPGFAHLGPAKDPTWHLYRHDSPRCEKPTMPAKPLPKSEGTAPQNPPPPPAPPAPLPLPTSEERAALLEHLKLPPNTPILIDFHVHPDGGWTFDECDGTGATIGRARRLADGQKFMVTGSRRGIYLPGGALDSTGSLYIVEGASDTLAMAGIGLGCLGRPSNRGGAEFLAELIRGGGVAAERPVVVVGENDRKPDGSWPGWDGAEQVARQLADAIPNPVSYTFPLHPFKDVREWISQLTFRNDRAEAPTFARTVIARYLDGGARKVEPQKKRDRTFVSADGWPVAMPASRLIALAERPTRWVWDGFLARGSVTLLSALPKCGKTTLLAAALKAMDAGGSFAGKPLAAGRAVVISEEDATQWGERGKELGIGEHVRFCCRPFAGRLSPEQWEAFCRHADETYRDADLIVFDTLANLWPVRDENSAAEVGNALLPLLRLANERALLLVHHLRKSDGAEGTAARGSGALAAGVDILLELRRMKGVPNGDRRRVLTGMGRPTGVPAEWIVERHEDGSYSGRDGDEAETRAAKAERREKKAEERADELKAAIRTILGTSDHALTRKELWESLPDALQVNEARFKAVLEEGEGNEWKREGSQGSGGGFRYSVVNDSGNNS